MLQILHSNAGMNLGKVNLKYMGDRLRNIKQVLLGCLFHRSEVYFPLLPL